MSKKAGYKPDYSYHGEEEYYINDGILDEDPGDTEYTDWCHQCNNQRLGYIDPSSNLFYCNQCWTAFSSPQQIQQPQPIQPIQQPQPIQQTQSQISETSQSSQPTESNKKKSRRGRKNKNKNKNKSQPNTNDNIPSNKQPLQQASNNNQNTKISPKNKQPLQQASNNKNNDNNNKSTDISDRPSIFDTVTIEQKNTPPKNFLSNRPSLFADTNDNSEIKTDKIEMKIDKSEIKTDLIIDEYENEIKIEPNPYIKSSPKMEKKKSIKKSKNKSVIERQYIGHRIESKKTYNRHIQQKRELIRERFGIDETKVNDIDFSIDHDKDFDKKAKRKHKSKHEEKPHINLVVIGHVDAGKSTLMGRLLYEYGIVTNKTMHKYKTQSVEKGKGSFAYAWVLDCHEEERKRGITVDVSTHYFETEHRCITLLDSPGHKDFIPNMISGASQADAAILVINSRVGDFETGFHINNGQTREHALIAKSLGVQQIIVAVNKMDCSDWDKKRFNMIMDQLKVFLKEIGFVNKTKNKKKRNVVFIPVSGLTGGNLIADNKRHLHDKIIKKDEYDKIKNKWWRKQKENDSYITNLSLFEVIDRLKPSSSILHDSLNGKLRMSITDIYKELNVGIVATGKIISGSIMNMQQILIQPLNLVTKIKNLISIENHSHKYKHKIAIKGDNIQLLLDIKDNNDEIFDQIKIGDIVTSPHEPLKLINRFQCKIVTMKNLTIPICKGHHVIIHTQSVEKEAYIYKIDHMLNKKSGQIEGNKKHIRHIKADECAIVTVKLKNKNDIILLDTYQSLKELGRCTIRRDGKTIALGLVETV